MATIASLLAEHVTLGVRSVDRIFVAGYVPRLQSEGLVVRFLLDRDFPIPSPAALGKIGQRYREAIGLRGRRARRAQPGRRRPLPRRASPGSS